MANIVEFTDRYPLSNKTIKINKVPVEIKGYLKADKFAEIVNTVANSCFDDNDSYRPEFREIAKRYVVIKYMTDIQIGDMNAAELFKASQGGTWYELVSCEVDKLPVWAELEKAIDEAINYMLLTRKTAFDDLCETLKDFADKMGDTKSLEEIAKRIENLDDKKVVEAIVNK